MEMACWGTSDRDTEVSSRRVTSLGHTVPCETSGRSLVH